MDLELKRKRIETVAKLAGVGVIGFFVAPFVFLAIKGLIGLIIAAIVTVVAVNMTPWFAAKVANWRLKAIKHEASKNPIETLQNEKVSEGGTRDSRIETAAQSRPSLH